jgi:hypothetical protein
LRTVYLFTIIIGTDKVNISEPINRRFMETKDKRPRGRPRIYSEGTSKDNEGAPKLNFRFDPLLYEHVTSRPEGPRTYLEGLVREDIERTKNAEAVESISSSDVPGQLLLLDAEA